MAYSWVIYSVCLGMISTWGRGIAFANMLSQPIFWAKYFEIVLFVCSWGAFLSLSHTREPHSQTWAFPVSRAQYKKTLWMEAFDKTGGFITSCMCYRLLPRLPLHRIYTHPSKTYLQFFYMKKPLCMNIAWLKDRLGLWDQSALGS